jgi:hypothetical protein
MVARPGAISLPLTGGQNQKVDERILAPQEFTEVTNARQTRDGRQLARDGFTVYPVNLVAGQVAAGGTNPIRCVGDGDLFIADSGDLPFWTYAYRAGVRSRVGGGSADSGYATAPLKSVGEGGVPSLIPERVIPVSNYRGEQEQTSSTCDYSASGEWLVTANLDAGAVVVVWRSRDSLEVVASYRVTPTNWSNPDATDSYVQCSVVCDTTSNKTAVAAVRRDGDVYIIYFEDAGDTPTIIDTTQTVMMNANENCCIDTCTIDSTDSFTIAMPQSTGVFLRNYTFGAVLDLNWSTNVFSPTTQYTMVTLDTEQGEHLWAVTSTDPAAVARSLRMGRVNNSGSATATSALLTLTAGAVPGIPFCTHKAKLEIEGFGVGYHMVAFTRFSSNLPRAVLYSWDGVNASILYPTGGWDYGVVAGRVFLNDIDGEYYSNETFPRLLLPMMQSGVSVAFDTDLAFDPGRPVFLKNLGAGELTLDPSSEGSLMPTYVMRGASESGLLALSGEVGQATHPLISYMTSGAVGWTMGAPSKNVRITSNSGDIDTGLTGAYAITFDVAPPGKLRKFAGTQWTEAMHGLPRQGRLALFKPMKAQHCELEPVRANETLIPGLTATVCDGVSTHSCGFLEAPVIVTLNQGGSTSGLAVGTYSITAVFEWVDASGRRYQSAPAVPRDITLLALNNYIEIHFSEPVACYEGASVTVYRTPVGGSEFKRDGSFMSTYVANNTSVQLTDDQLAVQETLYTSLGEVPNDPPPSAQRFARTRDRVWAYGLDRPEVVQASKLLTDARGIVWSNSPNYFLVLPEDVVAVETLDETAVVFTGSAVYTIGGSGPGDDGIGAFTEPGRIPGYVGCVSPRSVISADAGIFFLSQRGIELLPRGFGSAQWVGQPVMDDLATYSECRGVVADPENDLIIWSMVDPDTWFERLLVYDVRAQTWSKWYVPQIYGPTDGSNVPTVGLSVGGENPVRTVGDKAKKVILWADTSVRCRIQERNRAKDYYIDGSDDVQEDYVMPVWESGWMRFGGVSGWQIVRRMTVLCSPLNDDWTLRAEFSYNDSPGVEATAEWEWLEVQSYSVGESITLECALPIVQFESIKVTLSIVTSGENGTPLQIHSVMLHPEADGARLPKENRR